MSKNPIRKIGCEIDPVLTVQDSVLPKMGRISGWF
jgi:hypothetical protein